MPDFPRDQLPRLHEIAARLLDSRKPATPADHFARDLLVRFEDACAHAGLDRVLGELPADLEDDPGVTAALVNQLEATDLDGGGPRAARPGKVADCVVAALGLTLVDEPDRTIALDDSVRAALTAGMAPALEAALAPAALREAIVSHARAACQPAHAAACEKIAAQLDDRGLRVTKQPKIPLDASQAIQRHLHAAREAVLGQAVSAALDRGQAILAAAPGSTGATGAIIAARLDKPISLRLTPRQVLIARVVDDRASKVPASVLEALVDGLTELCRITWRRPEVAARPYSIRETYAVGDVIDHPKFGRGTVTAVVGQRIDVELADGKHTLVHART